MADARSPLYFVSYARKDSAWLRLLFRRSVSTTIGDCLIWNDTLLDAGDRWQEVIDEKLAQCQVAVLLVSRNFIASEFIRQQELPAILQRARRPAGDPQALKLFWLAVGMDHAAVTQALPDLAVYQAELAHQTPLPASPERLSEADRTRFRRLVDHGLQAAVDPPGAALRAQASPRYRVERMLGVGSRANVYRATDTELDRAVAIKVLRDLAGRQTFITDLKEALRTAEEPNFLNIYDVRNSGDSAWCVMQHFEGCSLRGLLDQWRLGTAQRPDPDTLRQIFVKLARAVDRAHRIGLSYGNLMPSSVVLDQHNEPFILPVGRHALPGNARGDLAGLLQRRASAPAADDGRTPCDEEGLAYLVPEQVVESGEPPDPVRADIYMLGLLAWELATGELPMRLEHPERLLDAADRSQLLAFRPLPPITRTRSLFPSRMQTMIQTMTEVLPSRRQRSLSEVLDEPDLHDRYCLVLARDSWRRCLAGEAGPRFVSDFYRALTTRFPHVKPYLQGIDGPDRLPRQESMLKQAVLMLFAFAQRSADQTEPNLLSGIAASHAGIPSALFRPFQQVLIGLICGDADLKLQARDPLCLASEDVAIRLRQRWSEALEPGMAYLSSRVQRMEPPASDYESM